jgi:pimeloyl-ACP methyl ester carboxylesterase
MSDYVVHGGEQTAAVVTQELRQAAQALRNVAQLMVTGAMGIGRDSIDLGSVPGGPSLVPLGAVVGPGGAQPSARLQTLRGACWETWDAVGAAGRRVHAAAQELGQDLTEAATRYEQAEREAIQQVGAQCSPLVETTGWAAVDAVLNGFMEGAPPGQRVAAEAIATLVGEASSGRPGEHGEQAAQDAAGVMSWMAWMMSGAQGKAGRIEVGSPLQHDSVRAVGLPTLVDLQMRANQGEDGSGAIVVTRMAPAGAGEDTWVVTVPGTIDEGDAVWGTLRLPEAMSGDTGDVGPAVMEAMERVGVPHGAKLVLNGHSQGGRHALNLSNDGDLARTYRIEGVVTSGAPSGTAETRPGMTVVQMEDPDDAVPGLDGSSWVEPTRDRFLVRSTPEPAPQVPGKDPGVFGWEHKGQNYRALAEQANQGQGHPELTHAVAGLGIGAAGGVTARSWVVPTGQAEPKPAARNVHERNSYVEKRMSFIKNARRP